MRPPWLQRRRRTPVATVNAQRSSQLQDDAAARIIPWALLLPAHPAVATVSAPPASPPSSTAAPFAFYCAAPPPVPPYRLACRSLVAAPRSWAATVTAVPSPCAHFLSQSRSLWLPSPCSTAASCVARRGPSFATPPRHASAAASAPDAAVVLSLFVVPPSLRPSPWLLHRQCVLSGSSASVDRSASPLSSPLSD